MSDHHTGTQLSGKTDLLYDETHPTHISIHQQPQNDAILIDDEIHRESVLIDDNVDIDEDLDHYNRQSYSHHSVSLSSSYIPHMSEHGSFVYPENHVIIDENESMESFDRSYSNDDCAATGGNQHIYDQDESMIGVPVVISVPNATYDSESDEHSDNNDNALDPTTTTMHTDKIDEELVCDSTIPNCEYHSRVGHHGDDNIISRTHTNTICEMYDDDDSSDGDDDGGNDDGDGEQTNSSLHRSWLPDLCTCMVKGYIRSQWVRRRSGLQRPHHLKQYVVWTQLFVLCAFMMSFWAPAEVDSTTFIFGISVYMFIAVTALPAFGFTTFLENQSYKLANCPKTIEEIDALDRRLFDQGMAAYEKCENHLDKHRSGGGFQQHLEYHPLQFFVPIRQLKHDLSRRPFWKKPYIYYLKLFGSAPSSDLSEHTPPPVPSSSTPQHTATSMPLSQQHEQRHPLYPTAPLSTADIKPSQDDSNKIDSIIDQSLPGPTTWWPHHLLSIFEIQQLCGVYSLPHGIPSCLLETLEKYESMRTKNFLSKGRNERISAGPGYVFATVDHRLRLNRNNTLHDSAHGVVGFHNNQVAVMRQQSLRGSYTNYQGNILCLPFHFRVLPKAVWPADDSITTPVPIYTTSTNPVHQPFSTASSRLGEPPGTSIAATPEPHHMKASSMEKTSYPLHHGNTHTQNANDSDGANGDGDHDHDPDPRLHLKTRRGKLIAISDTTSVESGDNKEGIVSASSQFISDVDGISVCSRCRIIQDDYRVVHCTFCHKCIEGFDHHCPFLNTCIGVRNYPSFFTLISMILIYELLSMYLLVRLLLLVYDIDITGNGDTFASFNHFAFGSQHTTAALVVWILALVWSAAGVFLIGSLVFFHVFLILTKQTTRDFLRSRRIAKRVRKEEKVELRRVREATRAAIPHQQQGRARPYPPSVFSFTYDIELGTTPTSPNFSTHQTRAHSRQLQETQEAVSAPQPTGNDSQTQSAQPPLQPQPQPQRALFNYSTVTPSRSSPERGSPCSVPPDHRHKELTQQQHQQHQQQQTTSATTFVIHNENDHHDNSSDDDDGDDPSRSSYPGRPCHNNSSPDASYQDDPSASQTPPPLRSPLQSSKSSTTLTEGGKYDGKRAIRIHHHSHTITSSPSSRTNGDPAYPGRTYGGPQLLDLPSHDNYMHNAITPSPSLTSHCDLASVPDYPTNTSAGDDASMSHLDEGDSTTVQSALPQHANGDDNHEPYHNASLTRVSSCQSSTETTPGNIPYSTSNLPAVNEVMPPIDSGFIPRLDSNVSSISTFTIGPQL